MKKLLFFMLLISVKASGQFYYQAEVTSSKSIAMAIGAQFKNNILALYNSAAPGFIEAAAVRHSYCVAIKERAALYTIAQGCALTLRQQVSAVRREQFSAGFSWSAGVGAKYYIGKRIALNTSIRFINFNTNKMLVLGIGISK